MPDTRGPFIQDLTDSDYRALGAFRYRIRQFIHFSEQAAKAEGLEAQQHQMLLAIRAFDQPSTPTIGQLAQQLLIRHHSAVGLIDRLAGRGLVERLKGKDDHRQVRVRLTASGSQKLLRLSRIHRQELRQTGPDLVETLRGLLEQTI